MGFADLEYTPVAPAPPPKNSRARAAARSAEKKARTPIVDPRRVEVTKLILAKLQRYGQMRRKDIDCTLLEFNGATLAMKNQKLIRFIGNAENGHWVLLPPPQE